MKGMNRRIWETMHWWKLPASPHIFHCSLRWFHFFSKHDQILWLAVQLHFAMMLSNSKIKIKIDYMVKCILLTYSFSFFLLSKGIWRLYDELCKHKNSGLNSACQRRCQSFAPVSACRTRNSPLIVGLCYELE